MDDTKTPPVRRIVYIFEVKNEDKLSKRRSMNDQFMKNLNFEKS